MSWTVTRGEEVNGGEDRKGEEEGKKWNKTKTSINSEEGLSHRDAPAKNQKLSANFFADSGGVIRLNWKG